MVGMMGRCCCPDSSGQETPPPICPTRLTDWTDDFSTGSTWYGLDSSPPVNRGFTLSPGKFCPHEFVSDGAGRWKWATAGPIVKPNYQVYTVHHPLFLGHTFGDVCEFSYDVRIGSEAIHLLTAPNAGVNFSFQTYMNHPSVSQLTSYFVDHGLSGPRITFSGSPTANFSSTALLAFNTTYRVTHKYTRHDASNFKIEVLLNGVSIASGTTSKTADYYCLLQARMLGVATPHTSMRWDLDPTTKVWMDNYQVVQSRP